MEKRRKKEWEFNFFSSLREKERKIMFNFAKNIDYVRSFI